MSTDDELLIALYADGLPSPAKRAAAAMPHRSPKGLGVRVSTLRKRGLIAPGRNFIPALDTPSPTTIGQPASPASEAPASRTARTEQESLVRCPGCMRVFFPSDSLAIRPTGGEE